MSTASDGVAMILAARQSGQPDWLPGAMEITTPTPGILPGSKFGLRLHPILNISRLHAGVDLGGPTGTPIHAPADGVVVLAEVRGGYGNTVVIDHGNSLGTLFGHNNRLLVEPGQVVERGDVIALMGSTGLSTGPHSHFETRIKGLPIDPEGVIDFAQEIDYDDLED
jgi:murein DD-endopeptidase MepM/ murein hydrolase activator NlpD